MVFDLSALNDISALIRGQDVGNGIRKVKVDAIQPDPNQPRKTFDEDSLSELSASIQSVGIIQPPVVRTHDQAYLLISGERRWRAARQLGWEMIDVIVRDDLNAHAQLVENIQREALSPWEIYRFVSGELDAGTTRADLAKALGKSRAWVTTYATVDKMPESLVTVLREGRITGITALRHLHRLLEDAPSVAAQLLRSSAQISRSMIEQAKNEASTHRAAHTAVAPTSQESSNRVDGEEEPVSPCIRIAAQADDVLLPSPNVARKTRSISRQKVRIRAHYENACWTVDYRRQREIDGAVSVSLEGDDGSVCFAPIEALRLQSIECN